VSGAADAQNGRNLAGKRKAKAGNRNKRNALVDLGKNPECYVQGSPIPRTSSGLIEGSRPKGGWNERGIENATKQYYLLRPQIQKAALGPLSFYVQDVRYAARAMDGGSGDVQDGGLLRESRKTVATMHRKSVCRESHGWRSKPDKS
jgi:hypothetical protein